MSWDDIFKLIAGIVVSFGGIGGIVSLIVKFMGNTIATRLQEKYNLQLNKELENYKSKLDNYNYISKTKFDAEFEIYRELSKNFTSLVRDISIMIPTGLASIPQNMEQRKEYDLKIYNNAIESCVSAQSTLYGNTPFITEEFFDKYSDILKMCNMQLFAFERRWNLSFSGNYEEKSNLNHTEYERTSDINEKFKQLNKDVRKYLAGLDVVN